MNDMNKLFKIFLVAILFVWMTLYIETNNTAEAANYVTIAKLYEYRIDTADSGKDYNHVHIYEKERGKRKEMICLKIGNQNHVCDKGRNPYKSFDELPSKLRKALLADPKLKFGRTCACGGDFGGGGADRPFFAKPEQFDYATEETTA